MRVRMPRRKRKGRVKEEEENSANTANTADVVLLDEEEEEESYRGRDKTNTRSKTSTETDTTGDATADTGTDSNGETPESDGVLTDTATTATTTGETSTTRTTTDASGDPEQTEDSGSMMSDSEGGEEGSDSGSYSEADDDVKARHYGRKVASLAMPVSSSLYDTKLVTHRLNEIPSLRIRRKGKYFISRCDGPSQPPMRFRFNKRGARIHEPGKEHLGPIERIVSNFCETVLGVGRVKLLPSRSRGERRVIWTSKSRALHLIRNLDGTGNYVINRFPGDIFLKDKQVLGITMRRHMLCADNRCGHHCGEPKEDSFGILQRAADPMVTYIMCRHMVQAMLTDSNGCKENKCKNFTKTCCKHLDIFVPEIESFCTFNTLQVFYNRLGHELKGQTFVCKPSYLYKGFGFRFIRSAAEFKSFYHMMEGKETSRHDFMVQRMIDSPMLYKSKKFDIRAFLLVVTLRHRRVVSFLHPGFCRIAFADFSKESEEVDEEDEENPKVVEDAYEDPQEKGSTLPSAETDELIDAKNRRLDSDMRKYVCTFQPPEELMRKAKLFKAGCLVPKRQDRSLPLEQVLEKRALNSVRRQLRHIGICITKAIENKVWNAFGCYQLFSMDLCVDTNKKVWLLEVNSYPMLDVDPMSPTQRAMVPAIIMEAMGLVFETTYKSFYHLRLRKHPDDEFKETGFLFMQNYEFIFSTKRILRMDYRAPKGLKDRQLPYYLRIAQVDEQMKRVERRKKVIDETKGTLKKRRMNRKATQIVHTPGTEDGDQ